MSLSTSSANGQIFMAGETYFISDIPRLLIRHYTSINKYPYCINLSL